MLTVNAVEGLRAHVGRWRKAGMRIAFVPTMGNLHAGHMSLVSRALAHADRVVCSVFVNPTQFGPGEDFEVYPRTPEEDRDLLTAGGVHLLYAPSVDEMYPYGADGATRMEIASLAGQLCGASRPGHFAGVVTVVCRLFNMVQPDVAVFGEKDFQQLAIIRRMVRDLAMPVEIVGAPIRREADGLAMSSRNRYLTAEERERAPELYRTLVSLSDALAAGALDWPALRAEGLARLERAGFEPDYLEIRHGEDLSIVGPEVRPLRVLAAAELGRARLIDNVGLSGPDTDR
jgi:pantoate--beta-alanine ligase